MEKLSFRLDVFEGPLDVLLYLISKKKLDIYDIPISELLDQYMDYLDSMSEMDMEITSDFLEMASRLVQIKSSMLLPKYEDDEEDPRSELVATLIEYKTCKLMAQALRGHAEGFDCFPGVPVEIEPDRTYRRRHLPQELKEAFLSAAVRAKRRMPPPDTAFRVIVGKKFISVASRAVHVLKALIKGGKRTFRSLFSDVRERSEAVATFLAVLELIKSGKIAVEDGEPGEEEISVKNRKKKL